MTKLRKNHSGFTIVELLVVIVVIGILAAITIVAYTGVSQRAIVSSLQSDLSNASTSIKLFQIDNTNYPNTISTDCNASPTTTTNLCLKKSSGNSYIGYSANNSASPQSFLLIAGNGNNNYKITNTTPLTQLAQTMQSGVTPGAVLELRASKANGGLTQGINSPSFTTTWTDTSGNNNNGTLTNMAGTTASGWVGSGTGGDPYRAKFDGVDDYVSLPALNVSPNKTFTLESWVYTPTSAPVGAWDMIYEESFIPGNGATSVLAVFDTAHAGFYMRDDVNAWGTSATPSAVCDGLLHHIVGVANGANLITYIDGVGYVGSIVPAGGMVTTLSRLGQQTNGTYSYHGSIVAIRIYPFALTATQVVQNYAAGPNL
jgi:prepilin-type N-terminal cleavage/methylation domain-containing protein